MPVYSYIARSRQGEPEKGSVEAPNPDEAVSILQARNLVVVSINEGGSFRLPTSLGLGRRDHSSVREPDLVVFVRSLAAMTEAGMPLLRSLEITREQTRSRQMNTVIKEMVREIRGGSTFRDAILKHPRVFSPFWAGLVESGEISGQLTNSLEQIAVYLEKRGAIQRKVLSALLYPAVLMVVAVAALLVFTLKIVPTFADLFYSIGTKLPPLTEMVIHLSKFLQTYFLLLLAVGVAAWLLFSSYIHTKRGRWQFDKFLLKMPVFGAVTQGIAAEEFASNLGTLLKAGVPILQSLEILISTCRNSVVVSVLQEVRSSVREGHPLTEPLSHTDVFPTMVTQMIAVGEQTGKLSTMLDELERYYEEQVSTAIQRMTTLLEPAMLVGMGLVIGTLVVGMYLPIFQISQTVTR
ncbi:MAG: type II secretion system F family protein [Candidatus Omnitrophica bacterium]|nr:type II secretion system F family protein [Candidatus Omnitrophota bacterium]